MNTAILVTARLGSTRFPRKMLTSIGNHTLIEQLILRARHFFSSVPIIVATTQLDEDDELVSVVERLGAITFRGLVEDVLLRHYDACRAHSIQSYLSLDGDDPFVDERAARVCLSLSQDYAYVHTTGLPIGMNCSGVNVAALAHVLKKKKPGNSEGWGRFFSNPSQEFPNATVSVSPAHGLYDFARLTMDYAEDILFARRIAELSGGTPVTSLGSEIITLLEEHEEKFVPSILEGMKNIASGLISSIRAHKAKQARQF